MGADRRDMNLSTDPSSQSSLRAGPSATGLLLLILALACKAPDPHGVNAVHDQAHSPQPEELSLLSTWALDRFLELNVLLESDAGYVALFAHNGEVVHAKAAGYANIASAEPMQLDTRFRIASIQPRNHGTFYPKPPQRTERASVPKAALWDHI